MSTPTLLETAYSLYTKDELRVTQILLISSLHSSSDSAYVEWLVDMISNGLSRGKNVDTLIELAEATTKSQYFPFEDSLIPYASDELLSRVLDRLFNVTLITTDLETCSDIMLLYVNKDKKQAPRILKIITEIRDIQYEYMVAACLLDTYKATCELLLSYSRLSVLREACADIYTGEDLEECKDVINKWLSTY